jgi:hypothetical protein
VYFFNLLNEKSLAGDKQLLIFLETGESRYCCYAFGELRMEFYPVGEYFSDQSIVGKSPVMLIAMEP